MSKRAHTYTEIDGIKKWTYCGPTMVYELTVDEKRKKKTLFINKDGEETILNGRDILELAKIF